MAFSTTDGKILETSEAGFNLFEFSPVELKELKSRDMIN